jgi:hypothetical protein
MNRRRWAAGAVVASVLALPAALPAQANPPAAPAPAAAGHHRPYTFAVIGDIPYGAEQVVDFPKVVAQINADPDVRLVSHLGDIKNGSSVCSDDYFQQIRADFDLFRDPLVYTIGDNEWTDCHRTNNGAYNPLERLSALREVFFPRPGRTLGRNSAAVRSEARFGFPENVRFRRADVSFGAVHIVGSNNGLAPWTGNTAATPEQTAEVLGRTASAVKVIHETFQSARSHSDRAVVLMTQADMFDPTVDRPTYANYYAFQPIVQAIAAESRGFKGPVYLLNGDSHVYNEDRPLAAGSSWLSFYGVTRAVPNLQRVTVDGSENNDDYLKFTVHPRGHRVLSWTQVPYKS